MTASNWRIVWASTVDGGLTVVELLRRENGQLHVRGVDMLDGTPILDIKPYLSSIPVETLRRGWLAEAESEKSHHTVKSQLKGSGRCCSNTFAANSQNYSVGAACAASLCQVSKLHPG